METATWIYDSFYDMTICSKCHEGATCIIDENTGDYTDWKSPYCPHCGAKMTNAED